MKKLILCVLMILPLAAQSAVEREVLANIRKMMAESGGRVTFSTLINEPSFNAAQKNFLKRLYEVFFEIPSLLKSRYNAEGKIPTREELGHSLGLSKGSVDLLLAVMQADPRVPKMFSLDAGTREIASLDVGIIDRFLQARGSVKKLSWLGDPLPAFDVETFDGKRITNGDLKGHPVLVYFWFTGCPPCGKVSPHLKELDRRYRRKGFRIVGINGDHVLQLTTTDEARARYLERKGIHYVNAHMDEATRKAYGGINIYPTLFFADESGIITDHFINYQTMETLEGAVLKVIE